MDRLISFSKKVLVALSFSLFMVACSKDENKTPEPEPPAAEASSVSPKEGVPGTVVKITGANFDQAGNALSVTMAGQPLDLVSRTATEVTVKAPEHAPGKSVMKVTASGELLKEINFTYLFPEVTAVTPTEADQGTQITLKGKYFKAYGDAVFVWFDDKKVIPDSISDETILLQAPEHKEGEATIYLEVMDVKSALAGTFHFTEPVSTAFKDSASGWRVWGDAQSFNQVPEYSSEGGVQNGYIYAVDKELGGIWYFVAPDYYLGDRSDAYGKWITFSLKQSVLGTIDYEPDVILEGNDFNIVFDAANNPDTIWTDYKIQISASGGWLINDLNGRAATESEIKEVLADLKAFKIRGEYKTGADIGSLDNPYFPGVN